MAEEEARTDSTLDAQRLELERLKIQLDYRKFVLGSVFAAIAIAAIPPSFQLATALLEYVKGQHEQKLKQEQFHESYVKEFLANALNQDIELRIRFSEYFKYVSAEEFRQDWERYHDELVKYRDRIRGNIDQLEKDWSSKTREHGASSVEAIEIERHLKWAYAEVGYAERDRSAVADPRAPVRNSAAAVQGAATAFGSLVSGGFFSSDPNDVRVQRSIRTNNPGGLNLSAWQRSRPGFVGVTPDDGNGVITVIFRTPEHGIASWYYLLRTRYGLGQSGSFTLDQLASKYAGSGAPASVAAGYVAAWKRLLPSDMDASQPFQIDDDKKMLALAKAMFKNEAGGQLPWSDEQIAYAMKNERENTLPP